MFTILPSRTVATIEQLPWQLQPQTQTTSCSSSPAVSSSVAARAVIVAPLTAAAPATAAVVLRKLRREMPLTGTFSSDISPPISKCSGISPLSIRAPCISAALARGRPLPALSAQYKPFVTLSQYIVTINLSLFSLFSDSSSFQTPGGKAHTHRQILYCR